MACELEIFTCQRVLAITVFFGFMIHHMLRVNLSIAIVEMITRNNSNVTEEDHGPRYYWDEEEKNEILGYFFWGYVLPQIPGGRLSEKFGTKIIVAIGLLTSSIVTLLTPLAAHLSYRWLVFARFCLGVGLGIHWPSTPPIATKWIAPDDMSTFTSHMIASSLGVAITLPVCGYLIAYWGWPSVFYVSGGVALIWSLSWCYLIYDTPEKHPRISANETEKLKKKIKNVDLGGKNPPIPWRQIFSSGPVWSIANGNTCLCCTFFIAFMQLPTYMNEVLHFDIKMNGWLSSLPYLDFAHDILACTIGLFRELAFYKIRKSHEDSVRLKTVLVVVTCIIIFSVRYLVSLATAIVADRIIKSKIVSKTAVRKFFNVCFFLGTGVLFTIQALWGYNSTVTLIVFIESFALMGLVTSGVYANCADIAPLYSGTIFGITQVPGALIGYVTTKVVGLVTKEKQGFEQWAYIFWMLVGVNLFAAIFSFIFTSGEEQNWNLPREMEMEELESS